MGVILVAYERESEQGALEQLLGNRGHQVVKASSGLAALDFARREPPHLIVSDIVLPRMDGFALCRKWKQDERLQSVPFVFYTRRHDDPKYERFALELGAERFLAQTAQPDALIAAIDQLLAHVPGAAATSDLEATASRRRPAQRSSEAHASPQQLEQAIARAQQKMAQAHSEAIAKLAAEHQQTQQQALAQLRTVHEQALDKARRDAEQSLHRLQAEHERALATTQQALTQSEQAAEQLRAQIAELEHSRDRAAAGEARFRHVFAANPVPMWMIDHATRGFIAVNDAALAMYGYTRAEFLALTADDLVGEAPLDFKDDALVHKSKAGELRFVTVSSEPIEFDGRHADLVCAFDLTKRINNNQQRHLEFLVELFKQAESLDESAIVRRVVDEVTLASGSQLGFWYFVDPAQETLALAAWRDQAKPHATLTSGEPLPLASAGLLTECIRARVPTSSNEVSEQSQAAGLPSLNRYLAVPMIADGRTVAILGVANRDAAFVDEDRALLSALADGTWRIVQSKRAHAFTLGALQRTDVALQGLVDSLIRMSERHDPYTAGSARRVAALAVALAREAGLDSQCQDAIRLAALLHDIGNIAVPASVLSKPGPLTEHEIALVRTHAEEGCKLLADIDFGAPVADIVFEHHERIDGSGYPRGAKGDDISIEARVIAIADTVEAMCSARPHRPALGMDAALDEINKNAGRLYDLHLVSACTRLVRQRGFVLPE